MYVCVCNAVTENQIRQAVAGGVRSFETLQMHTGCATCCGCCAPLAQAILQEAVEAESRQPPEHPRPSLTIPFAASR